MSESQNPATSQNSAPTGDGHHASHHGEGHPPSWLERNVQWVVRGVIALAVATVVFDLVYGFVGHKHVHFAVEGWPGFYAAVGFASYVFLVLSAKQLRKVVSRPENFYDAQPPLLAFDPAAALEKHGHGHDDHGDDHHGHDHDTPGHDPHQDEDHGEEAH